ncbi:MAG: hypothetical protein E6J63_20035 [Deltaproteobacteria bacterium]|nr:MAG: hypothetical protein E6J63_20035 [Deltaproteobacteria bacterium]
MELLALTVAAALALLVLLRRPGLLSPVLLAEGGLPVPASPAPGDDEEQLPETDRAPRSWLPWTIAAVGVLRLVLLVTLNA